jgi:hypothetical protein
MYDSYKIMEHLEKEVDKKAETGIRSTTDLDTVVKLSEAMKNFAKAEYYCTVTEAMNEEGYSHEDGYSERRKRDSMGRYSRHDGYDRGSSYNQGGYSEARDRYMEDKHSYRSTRSADSKRDMNVSLHDCMNKLREELQEMMSNADTREERDKIKEMIREIGNLA